MFQIKAYHDSFPQNEMLKKKGIYTYKDNYDRCTCTFEGE